MADASKSMHEALTIAGKHYSGVVDTLRADLARVAEERDRLRADMLAIQTAAEGINRTVNDSVGERLWAVKQIARAALADTAEGAG